MKAPCEVIYAPMAASTLTRSARKRPSASSASSASVMVSRACWSGTNASERVGELVAQHGDALRAAAQDIAVLRRVVGRRRAARLHRGDDHTPVDQRDTRHVRRVAEGLVKRAPSLGLAAESKVYG